ncbi:P-type E1-E2 ATPase/heavy metal translocating P-type ATPase [Rhodobacter sp. 140A]|nr:P-type E1-E2 ATPase/heavy metal translocating P-type ATPase [Rhodobacter sp. 140A]
MSRTSTALLALAIAGLVLGLGLHFAGHGPAAQILWTLGTLPVLAALLIEIVRALARGEVGLDIVAALSMSAALLFGETLAAQVVAVMYAGGTFLEAYAEGRARADMSALLARVPRVAHRHSGDGLEEVALEALVPGDRILVRRGEVTPVDGTLASATALLDTSALTGESLPVRIGPGASVMSGAANAGEAFDMIATRRAAESTYAGIVRLVEAAARARAPMARMADRASLGFLAVTLAIAGAAWGLTGDPIRAVAVLVIATPCPLILAVPVALVAGLSRAARFGVLIKGAQALEALSRVRVLILDKTGTLTDGMPKLTAIRTEGFDETEALRLAAALEQASGHPVAQALVAEAQGRGLSLPVPEAMCEAPGEGLTGRIEGHTVAIGGPGFVAAALGQPAPELPPAEPGALRVTLGVDGRIVAHLTLADRLREDTPGFLAAARRLGIRRIILATGDRPEIAERIAAPLGLDLVEAGLVPAQKVAIVLRERAEGPVMMVGDGVNDAPALAAADVGVAMGARGAAASAEAAQVVLLVDRLDRLLPGIEVAQRSIAIAWQSVAVGLGLSVLGMIAAAFGLISPVEGAIAQEAIDVAVILNALRALAIRPRGIAPATEAA